MEPLEFINRMNEVFEKHASQSEHLDQIGATRREMLKDPRKAAQLEKLEKDLRSLIEVAFNKEMDTDNPPDITKKEGFFLIIEAVSERVIAENPEVLPPLIRPETAYYTTYIAYHAARQIPPQDNQPSCDPR